MRRLELRTLFIFSHDGDDLLSLRHNLKWKKLKLKVGKAAIKYDTTHISVLWESNKLKTGSPVNLKYRAMCVFHQLTSFTFVLNPTRLLISKRGVKVESRANIFTGLCAICGQCVRLTRGEITVSNAAVIIKSWIYICILHNFCYCLSCFPAENFHRFFLQILQFSAQIALNLVFFCKKIGPNFF